MFTTLLLGKMFSMVSGMVSSSPHWDAKSEYWTKQLDEQSQLFTVFNTPFKKYCFVPFGLSASSEIFCTHMDRILAGIPGTFPCADDVKVQGQQRSVMTFTYGNCRESLPSGT